MKEPTLEKITKLYNQDFSLKKISENLNIPYSTVYAYTRLKERGFKSVTDYLKFRAKKKGYKTSNEYHKNIVKKNYNQTLHERKEFLAKRAGFKSKRDREEFWAEQKGTTLKEIRRKRKDERKKKNKEISDLIKKRLEELGETGISLSKKLDVSYGKIQRYVSGASTIPRDTLPKLAKAIDIDYSELEKVYEGKE